jgi:hypothetical protein
MVVGYEHFIFFKWRSHLCLAGLVSPVPSGEGRRNGGAAARLRGGAREALQSALMLVDVLAERCELAAT